MAGPHPPSPHTPRRCRLLADLLGAAVVSIRGRWFLEWLRVRISERKDLIPRQGLYTVTAGPRSGRSWGQQNPEPARRRLCAVQNPWGPARSSELCQQP